MTEVHGEVVSYPGGTGAASGYLAAPADDLPHGGIVVIQEWWGLNEHIKDVARRFAREGFIALSPDLYHGRVAADPSEAMQLSRALKADDGAADVLAAIDYLKGLARVQPKKVGVIGFCMGGSFTLEAAIRSPDVAAAAPFYAGRVGQLLEQVHRITAPMFVPFGAEDPSIPLATVEQFRLVVAREGKQAEIQVYAGAPHAFHNETVPNYREAAAKDAWARSLSLFRQHVR